MGLNKSVFETITTQNGKLRTWHNCKKND